MRTAGSSARRRRVDRSWRCGPNGAATSGGAWDARSGEAAAEAGATNAMGVRKKTACTRGRPEHRQTVAHHDARQAVGARSSCCHSMRRRPAATIRRLQCISARRTAARSSRASRRPSSRRAFGDVGHCDQSGRSRSSLTEAVKARAQDADIDYLDPAAAEDGSGWVPPTIAASGGGGRVRV